MVGRHAWAARLARPRAAPAVDRSTAWPSRPARPAAPPPAAQSPPAVHPFYRRPAPARPQVRHSHQDILNTLFEGLRRLEYRGYDSAGVSVDWPVQLEGERAPTSRPVVIKAKGKVDDLVKLCTEEVKKVTFDPRATVPAHAGISHTRWATHGPPCARNSHPHVSSAEHEFVVVHNGTITNFRALKEFLVSPGRAELGCLQPFACGGHDADCLLPSTPA